MNSGFQTTSLEQRYAFLDECPAGLIAAVVTFPEGDLRERVAGIRAWRAALLEGRSPPVDAWPAGSLSMPARQALEALDVARFCKGEPELVDALLADVLSSVRSSGDAQRAEMLVRLRELEALERERLEDEERASTRGYRDRSIDDQILRKLRVQAEQDIRAKTREADATLLSKWQEQVRVWAEIFDVFGDLGQLMGRGWDLSQGVLLHVGWRELVKLRELVARLPQLREVICALGRLHASDREQSVAEAIMAPVRRLEEELRVVTTFHVPAETKGIERSGEVARMLPLEAAMLGHRKLRLLWHARRAERALLTWRYEGTEVERVLVERESQEATEGRKPRPERGPILAVVDTSGSMHGLPEQVAKALVLEALRTAHTEKRRCFLYVYSGPGQVKERELDLTRNGFGCLLDFLGLTFGGGNDEAGVMARVTARLRENDWRKADVIFVSDGEWPATSELVSTVSREREHGTRFHGVQIGNRGSTGLHAVCDPVHVFTEWAALCGWTNRV